jgi:hypothetical protein
MTLPNKILCALGIAGAAVVVACVVASTNPLRKDASVIRTRFLQETPFGSSLHDVNAVIAGKGWKERYRWQRSPVDPFAPTTSEQVDTEFPEIKAASIICVQIGGYQGWPWYTNVESDWAFDTNGKLVGLRISKIEDAL